ncbi:hypothetical protein [Chlorella virus XW01]|nr:hypothetical protein [Chlorella virus XW01]
MSEEDLESVDSFESALSHISYKKDNKLDLEKIEGINLNTKYIITKYISNNIFYTNNKIICALVDNKILDNLKKLSLNRKLNYSHWNELLNFYKSIEGEEILIPNIISVGLFNNKFYILDGQHRIKAIKELLKYKKIKVKITLNLYIVNERKELLILIDKINSSLLLSFDLNISNDILELIEMIKNKFHIIKNNEKKSILIESNKKAVRPFLSEYKLVNKLKELNIIGINKPDKILKKILKINNKYKLILQENPKHFTFLTKKMIETATSYDCYLGLDKNYEWIDNIIDDI